MYPIEGVNVIALSAATLKSIDDPADMDICPYPDISVREVVSVYNFDVINVPVPSLNTLA